MLGKAAVLGLVAGAWVVAPLRAQVVISDAPSCGDCRIERTVVATLGDVDGPGSLARAPAGVAVDPLGRYWVLQSGGDSPMPDPPLIYDSSGRFLRQLGSRGPGPEEFTAVNLVVALPGDSMLVFDRGARRATVVGPDLRVARSVAVANAVYAAVVVRWPDLVLVNADIRSPEERTGYVIHELDLSGMAALVGRSFGEQAGPAPRMLESQAYVGRRFAPGAGGSLWVLNARQHQFSQWSAAGAEQASFRREASWFFRADRERPAGGDGEQNSMVVALQQDADGRLWSFSLVSRPGWQVAWDAMMDRLFPGGRPQGAFEVAVSELPPVHVLYRTMVEVLDPSTARVVARDTIDETIVAALPGNRAVAYSEDALGIPRLTILTFALTGSRP